MAPLCFAVRPSSLLAGPFLLIDAQEHHGLSGKRVSAVRWHDRYSGTR
jgi:hypothetical protein